MIMRSRSKASAIVCLIIPLSTLANAATNEIQNGSFESYGTLNKNGWGLFNTIPGWKAIKGKIEIQTGTVGGIAAAQGNAKLELDSTQNSTIQQELTNLTPGKKYQLTLKYSPRVKNHKNTNRVRVTWNGKLVTLLNGKTVGWKPYTFEVTAGKVNRLRLVALGTSDTYGGLIDDVQLVCMDCGTTPPPPPPPPVPVNITVLSPADFVSVPYSFITLQVSSTGVNTVTAKNLTTANSTEQIGVNNGDDFLIYNVFLQEGQNIIEISANNGTSKKTLTINSEGLGFPPIALEVAEDKGIGLLNTAATVKHSAITGAEFWIDQDGDHVIDQSGSSPTMTLNFDAPGSYELSALVKTTNNILYASIPTYDPTVNVIENPTASTITLTHIAQAANDIQLYQGFIYLLTDNALLKIPSNNYTQVETITLSGMSSPQGFDFDRDGNIYLADTGANRVVRLLAASGYQVDSRFVLNTAGVGNGELSSPKDIVVSIINDQPRVAVLDAGNNRIQVFDDKAKYLYRFDGSTTAEGKLNNPLNMIGGANHFTITDLGNQRVREISYDESSAQESGESLVSLASFGKITESENGYLLPDNVSRQLLFMRGSVVESRLPMVQGSSIAFAYNQDMEVIFLPSAQSVMQHLVIPQTAAEAAPKALAEGFVQAYLSGNKETQYQLATLKAIKKLEQADDAAKRVFGSIKSYEEAVYFHGFKAAAYGKTDGSQGVSTIRFDFEWVNERWILKQVF